MRSRLSLSGIVVLFVLGSAGTATAAPTQPEACFGAFASTFAQENPKSGRMVSDMARSAPGAVGTAASEKPMCP